MCRFDVVRGTQERCAIAIKIPKTRSLSREIDHHAQRVIGVGATPSLPTEEIMSPVGIGSIVFVCIFGSAMLGRYLRTVLPDHHLTDDSCVSSR